MYADGSHPGPLQLAVVLQAHTLEFSVVASSYCRAPQVKNAMFEYGRHLGLAFQIVDDILDFTTATEQLGKPQVRLTPSAQCPSASCAEAWPVAYLPC